MKGIVCLKNFTFSSKDFEKYAEQARAYARKSAFPVMAVNKSLNEEFMNTYSGSGKLKVSVTSGQGTLPVQLANVEVNTIFNGEKLLLFSGKTDSSGIVKNTVLPALPTELSENYETAENSGIEYFVNVKHASFQEVIDAPIKIYNEIESILPVNLIPILR